MSVKILVNDVQYEIPQNWSEITIAQQIEVSMVSERDEDFRNIHLISTYTGIPMDLIRKMNINQFRSILNLMTFISNPPENKIIQSFTHNGHEYFLADSMLKGETQDFLSIEGILRKFKDNQAQALPYVIAIICKRQGETLDSFDVYQRAEEFKTLSYQVASDVWFFFAQTERILSNNIQQFLVIQDRAMEASLDYSETMLKRQVGQGLFKRLLRTILVLYVRSIRKSWKSFLTTTQSVPSSPNWIRRLVKNRLRKLRIDVKQ